MHLQARLNQNHPFRLKPTMATGTDSSPPTSVNTSKDATATGTDNISHDDDLDHVRRTLWQILIKYLDHWSGMDPRVSARHPMRS